MIKLLVLFVVLGWGLIIVSKEGDKTSIIQPTDPDWKEKAGIIQNGPNSWTNIKESDRVIVIEENGVKTIKIKGE